MLLSPASKQPPSPKWSNPHYFFQCTTCADRRLSRRHAKHEILIFLCFKEPDWRSSVAKAKAMDGKPTSCCCAIPARPNSHIASSGKPEVLRADGLTEQHLAWEIVALQRDPVPVLTASLLKISPPF
jgi:hypothetical protein